MVTVPGRRKRRTKTLRVRRTPRLLYLAGLVAFLTAGGKKAAPVAAAR